MLPELDGDSFMIHLLFFIVVAMFDRKGFGHEVVRNSSHLRLTAPTLHMGPTKYGRGQNSRVTGLSVHPAATA